MQWRLKKINLFLLAWFLFWIVVLFTNQLYLKPRIDSCYFYNDIQSFYKNYWSISIILFFILLSTFFIGWRMRNKINLINFASLLVYTSFLTLSLKDPAKNLMLLLNSAFVKNKVALVYSMSRTGNDKYYFFYDEKKEFLNNFEDIKLIDLQRNQRKLKKTNLLKHNDTIHIDYKIGFLNIKYPNISLKKK